MMFFTWETVAFPSQPFPGWDAAGWGEMLCSEGARLPASHWCQHPRRKLRSSSPSPQTTSGPANVPAAWRRAAGLGHGRLQSNPGGNKRGRGASRSATTSAANTSSEAAAACSPGPKMREKSY